MAREDWINKEGHLDPLVVFRDFLAETFTGCDVEIGLDPTDVLAYLDDVPLITVSDELPVNNSLHGWGGTKLLAGVGLDVDVWSRGAAVIKARAVAHSISLLGSALMEDPATGFVEVLCTAEPHTRPVGVKGDIRRRGVEFAARYHVWHG